MGQRYKLLEEIGRGGMGVVYRARDTALERDVALKLWSDDGPEDEEGHEDDEVRLRFRREVETCAALAHPGIVRVLDSGEAEGRLFYTMELLCGSDLSRLVESEGHLDPARAGELLGQAAAALAYLHAQGVIHRDLKPANLFLEATGRLKLMDFGLVRDTNRANLTQNRRCLGTLRFMPPESLRDDAPAPARDLYSLGLTFWEAVAGVHPFREGQIHALLQDICNLQPAPLAALRANVPAWLSDLVDRCIAKDPTKRPTAAEVARACAQAVPGSGSRIVLDPTVAVETGAGPACGSADAEPGAEGKSAGTRGPPARGAARAGRPAVALLAGVALLGAVTGMIALAVRPARRPGGAASPAAASSDDAAHALAEWAEELPIDALVWLPTHDSVLVDFDIRDGEPVTVDVGPPGRTGPGMVAAAPAGARAFRRVFGGLAPARPWTVRLARGAGPPLVEVPFNTLPPEHALHREEAIRLLRAGNAMDELGLEALDREPDLAVVPELTRIVAAPGTTLTVRERAARLLARLRDPGAAGALADATRSARDPYVVLWLLRAAAACRSARVDETAEHAMTHNPETAERVVLALGTRQNETAFDWLALRPPGGLPAWCGLGPALVRASPVRASARLDELAAAPRHPASAQDWPAIEAAAALPRPRAVAALAPFLDPARAGPLRSEAALELSLLAHPLADSALAAAFAREPAAVDLAFACARRGLASPTYRDGLASGPLLLRVACALGAGAMPANAPGAPAESALLALAGESALVLRAAALHALARRGALEALHGLAVSGKDRDGRAALAFANGVAAARGRSALPEPETTGRAGPTPRAADLAALAGRLATASRDEDLPRRARIALALHGLKHPEAPARLAELAALPETDAGSRFARWVGRQLAPRPARQTAREDAGAHLAWLDTALPAHATGVMLAPGQVIWLRATGAWMRGGITTLSTDRPDPAGVRPFAHLPRQRTTLERPWEALLARTGGEISIWLHGAPHQVTPGASDAALADPPDGLLCVAVARTPPAP